MSAPAGDEFSPGASSPPQGLERREFLRLAGIAAALGGWTGGCYRPAKTLAPYVVPPDGWVPGQKTYYATGMPWEGYARGILVETHEGRPTKIEGNPHHRESGGATDALTQAAIRDLYDPDRSSAPMRGADIAAWADFETEWLPRWEALRRSQGEGWAVLTEPATSPTLRRLLQRWRAAFPRAQWFQHTPLPRYDREGRQEDLSLEAADVVFSIGSDFLLGHPAALRHAREFAGRRRVENGRVRANRLYAVEAGWTITGGMADERLALRPSRWGALLDAIADGIAGEGNALGRLDRAAADFAAKLSADLKRAGPAALCVAGPEQPPATRAWAEAMNRRLGAVGRTVRYVEAVRSDGDSASAGGLEELAAALERGKIRSLCILGGNPVYASPPELRVAEAIGRAEFSLHLGEYRDETAQVCRWHLPQSHFLEGWGDALGYDGSLIIQQPMIDSLHDSRSIAQVLHLLTTALPADGFDLVRATHAVDEQTWERWLNEGVGPAPGPAPVSPPAAALPRLAAEPAPAAADEWEIVIRPEPFLRDGRSANNPWLQELPRPFTAAVWDNALWVSPEWARRHDLVSGDLVAIEAAGRRVEAAVLCVSGTAEGCAIAELGGGRWASGETGNRRGFNAFTLQGRGPEERWLGKAAVRKTGRKTLLVRIQSEFEMEGRDPVHLFAAPDLDRMRAEPDPALTLFPTPPAHSPAAGPAQPHHRWGMLIDLSACIGCTACVAACQAENNTPAVGKEQCGRGRHMHWIRVDRYETEDGRRSSPQPLPCMQCERAPCELVCPVGATVHSSEGLNDMVYNRCVGTRYCSNNCPYKVRRFNFLDYRSPPASPLHLQENPAVTVRERGVMEKCSYCVQRIDQGRIAAERENRPLRDGDVRTACQQACPAQAIAFGDLSDPDSAVLRRKSERTHFAVLSELNTRPRTTYLARLVNPA